MHRKRPLPTGFSSPIPGQCRWCSDPITKILKNGSISKSTWHSECVKIYKFYHWPSYTRKVIWKRDKGVCNSCGIKCDRKGTNGWEMDHVIPLFLANGQLWAWDRENLQTLCKPCHKKKTAAEATARSKMKK